MDLIGYYRDNQKWKFELLHQLLNYELAIFVRSESEAKAFLEFISQYHQDNSCDMFIGLYFKHIADNYAYCFMFGTNDRKVLVYRNLSFYAERNIEVLSWSYFSKTQGLR